MRERVLRREQVLDVPVEEAFAFFSRAENLEAITPPLLRFRIVTPEPVEMGTGTLIRYRLRLHGLPVSWLTRIEEWDPPHAFVDRQLRGPYALWHHTHSFEPLDGGARTRMTDLVRYAHRLGPLGTIVERLVVRRDLDRIFDFRRDSIPGLLARGAAA
ncbi:MAG: SRPBCC family protein [Solirubrobacterales bacterium]|nr:SRPBCC family protein [Solirubrobacterales bacterium]MCB8971526.1 SRPBCC family protein [Thermoleophilales bacterium]MCO5328334.1 SRPBCC family protein [Solirubrobacterales bacterium]